MSRYSPSLSALISSPVFWRLSSSFQNRSCYISSKKTKKKPLLTRMNWKKKKKKNYRSVSSLQFVSKIIEKSVLSQLSEHLSAYNLYTCCQSAYWPGHSTKTALLKIVSDFPSLLMLERFLWSLFWTCQQPSIRYTIAYHSTNFIMIREYKTRL